MSESFAYHTDLTWFENIKNSGITDKINFWITDRKINLFPGEIFFMKNNRRFIGMARVNRVESGVTIKDAWDRYGIGNGALGLFAMIQRISEVLDDKSANQDYAITCIILSGFTPINPVSFDDAGLPYFQTNKRLTGDETEKLLKII